MEGPATWDMGPLVGALVPTFEPSLTDMPLEILEVVFGHLTLRNRAILVSCCKGLWVRPDLLSSHALWGEIHITWLREPETGSKVALWGSDDDGGKSPLSGWPGVSSMGMRCSEPGAVFRSLCAWVARRAAAVRRLYVTRQTCRPAELLLCLAGGSSWDESWGGSSSSSSSRWGGYNLGCSWSGGGGGSSSSGDNSRTCGLASLCLSHMPAVGNEGEAVLQPLLYLRSLTLITLNHCGLKRLPPQLLAPPALAELDLRFNPQLGDAGEPAFGLLPGLPGLRRLALDCCKLRALPRQLSALTSLTELTLSGNSLLGEGSSNEVFQLLEHLASLRRLDVSWCSLYMVPPQLQLTPLQALEELSMAGNGDLGRAGRSALEPLFGCAGLRQLDLSYCGISVMQQLELAVQFDESGVHVKWR